MALQDILVHLSSDQKNTARVDAAIKLAIQHDAHLTGLYAIPPVYLPTYAEAQIPNEILRKQEQELRAAADKVGLEFRAAIDKAGCAGEWLCSKGYTDQLLNSQARYTDLLVLSQAEDARLVSTEAAVENHVIMGSARPVLFIPYIGLGDTLGKRVMIAWNGSQEAVRAINDALPILQQAEKVSVVAVNPPSSEGDIPTADMCAHLARHHVKVEGDQVFAKDISVGDILLSRAADQGIDLLVMGAYGHTRLREAILGGVTKHMLEHMTIPILMSH